MSQQSFLKPGQTIDNRYTILQQIGHGGFGRTYLATDSRRHHERCVLKEFAPLLTARPGDVAKARELFQREAAVLHRLDHPQIPEFREEFELHDGSHSRWILVQEWIEGETYLNLLRSGPFLEVQVIQFLRDFLPILDYLHRNNPPVIHRDIALDNILFNVATNQPTLIDFGTVKQAVTQISGVAESRTYVAKQGYSAPELALGEAYASSDLYSLGVCAIALLTGQPNPAQFHDPQRDRWFWQPYATVSPGFAALIDRLVTAQPEYRYSSAAEVLDQLNRWQAQALPPTQVLSSPPSHTAYPTRIQPPGTALQPIPPQSHTAQPVYSQTHARTNAQLAGLPRELPLTPAARISSQNSSHRAPTTARTVAVGRAPQTVVHGRAASPSYPRPPQSGPTEYIWPIWVRPLLFVQPLLSLLAYRIGPALLALLLVYGGIRRAVPWVIAQTQQALPEFASGSEAVPNVGTGSPEASQAENPDIEETVAIEPVTPVPNRNASEANPNVEEVQTKDKSAVGESSANESATDEPPTIAIPDVELPDIEFPNIKFPTVKFPSIKPPKIEPPKVQWPELPKIGFPEFKSPEFKVPKFEMPKLEMPEFWRMAEARSKDPVKRCRAKAISRFNKLPEEQASWSEVDRQFQERHPEQTAPLDIDNPDHRPYVESWCEIAHQWLDQAEK